MYQASAYFLARSLAEVPTQLIPPFVLGTIVYWITNLERDAGKYFVFIAFVELGAFSAMSLGLAISAVARTTTLAAALVPLFVEVFRLFGAFYVTPNLMSQDYPYFLWITSVSFVQYAYLGVFQNEFQGMEIECPQGLVCPFRTGQEYLESLDSEFIPIWACALVLIAMIILFRFIAYLGIRFIKF
jgi:hypothetical protein